MSLSNIGVLALRWGFVLLFAAVGRTSLGAPVARRDTSSATRAPAAQATPVVQGGKACFAPEDSSAGDDGLPPARVLPPPVDPETSSQAVLHERRRAAAESSLAHLRSNGQADASGART